MPRKRHSNFTGATDNKSMTGDGRFSAHRTAKIIRDFPKGVAELFLVGFGHGLMRRPFYFCGEFSSSVWTNKSHSILVEERLDVPVNLLLLLFIFNS
jgi:hypothetical protein